MYAILHAFVLWHKDWANGRVRLACDNSVVVDAIHKRSVAGPAIRPLQTILLIAAVFDIDLVPFWILRKRTLLRMLPLGMISQSLLTWGFRIKSIPYATAILPQGYRLCARGCSPPL